MGILKVFFNNTPVSYTHLDVYKRQALVLVLLVLGGGEAFAYIKFIRPKQAAKASADPDDYDFADEEEYINEDEPEQPEDGPKESEDTL